MLNGDNAASEISNTVLFNFENFQQPMPTGILNTNTNATTCNLNTTWHKF